VFDLQKVDETAVVNNKGDRFATTKWIYGVYGDDGTGQEAMNWTMKIYGSASWINLNRTSLSIHFQIHKKEP
jgi:hypothetical protein